MERIRMKSERRVMRPPTPATIPTMTRSRKDAELALLSPATSQSCDSRYWVIATSPGLLTSMIRREGWRVTPEPSVRFISSINCCGTKMVFNRFEKPATRPCIFSTCSPSSDERRNVIGILPMSPSESWGSPAEEANPKL